MRDAKQIRPRDSEWMVLRRCLVLIECLLRGPASKDDLVERVRRRLDDEAYQANSASGRISAFERDVNVRLPKLGCTARFNRQTGQYELVDIEALPGFDVPDRALSALAFLEDTFQPGTPNYAGAQALLQHLRLCLTEDRRADLERATRCTAGQPAPTQRPFHPRQCQPGHRARQGTAPSACAFAIFPRHLKDHRPRTHTVEPYDYYFDSVWGHEYLYAYCRSVDGPDGIQHVNSYIRYRPERILTDGIEVLETRLPPGQPRVKRNSLVYRLAPAIARLGDVSRHFQGMETTPQEDGSVIVQAEVDDLFFALRTLLHYGSMCEVLGGPRRCAKCVRSCRGWRNCTEIRRRSQRSTHVCG